MECADPAGFFGNAGAQGESTADDEERKIEKDATREKVVSEVGADRAVDVPQMFSNPMTKGVGGLSYVREATSAAADDVDGVG